MSDTKPQFLTIVETPVVVETGYGLYKTKYGHYYWHFKTFNETTDDCMWFDLPMNVNDYVTFFRKQDRTTDDTKIKGSVKLNF